MKELTPKQQRIWDLQQSGKSHAQISQELGISGPVVNKTLGTCRKKLGVVAVPGEANGLEHKNPERFAAVFDAASETKLTKLGEVLRENGVPDGAAEGIIKRIRVKFYGAISEVRNLKKMELDEMLGKKIHLMLSYIDDKVAAEASARDLAMGVSQLIEKQALVRGEPTVIISDLERKRLHELMPLLITEGKRRGITIEGEGKVISAVNEVVNATQTG